MNRAKEHTDIWEKVKNSEKLFEVYGYFPTLHDATIKRIDVNLEDRSFSLTVDYNDLVAESEHSGSTRFTIRWKNVKSAKFNWYAEDLFGMDFQKEGDVIRTKFTDYSFGF